METQDNYAKADALRELAKAQLEEGNVEAAEKYVDEIEHLQSLAEKEADLENRLVKAQTAERTPRNRVPVASTDVAEDSLNEKRSDGNYRGHVDSDYKPSGWNKSLPAMSQVSWIKEKMGQNLKDEAAFQTATFAKWFTAKSQDAFFRESSADERKAMEQGVDSEGKIICLAS